MNYNKDVFAANRAKSTPAGEDFSFHFRLTAEKISTLLSHNAPFLSKSHFQAKKPKIWSQSGAFSRIFVSFNYPSLRFNKGEFIALCIWGKNRCWATFYKSVFPTFGAPGWIHQHPPEKQKQQQKETNRTRNHQNKGAVNTKQQLAKKSTCAIGAHKQGADQIINFKQYFYRC